MGFERVSRNQPCPCGSGKKYKQCCYRKNFSFDEDQNGTIRRQVPIDKSLADMLRDELKIDPDIDPPDRLLFENTNLEHAEHEFTKVLEQIGIDPAIIYAFQETGLLVSEENLDQFSQLDLDLWQSKIDEYRLKESGEVDSAQFPMGTIAFYGPDAAQTTKIVAAVILHSEAEPILERFVGSSVAEDDRVTESIQDFFSRYKVATIVHSEGNIGCPHEEGEDFPLGGDCPFCPYWKGKQGSNQDF